MQQDYNNVEIRLHTYGGSVVDGNLMYNAINKATAKVEMIIEGLAASMGSILLTATPNVKIVENGYIMIHAPSGGGPGTAKDLTQFAKLLKAMETNFVTKLKERTGKPQKEVEALMDGNNWIDAQEAKKIGLVTDVIPSVTQTPLEITEPEDFGELEVFNAYAGLMTSEISNTQKPEINMKQLIITALALAAVTNESSDTAVMAAVNEKFKNLEDELKKANEAKTTAEASLVTFKEKQVNDLVEAYAKKAKLSQEKKEVYATIGKTSGMEALMSIMGDVPAQGAPGIGNMIQSQKPANDARANWDWEKYQKEDPRGLETLATENPEAYNELFNAKYQK
jgi:ATP-dependent Clp endopeptidase proteolytic subunit ClpP